MNHFEKILSEYEVRVLRICGGLEESSIIAGAALWQAVEVLEGLGLVEAHEGSGKTAYFITEKGLQVLKELPQ